MYSRLFCVFNLNLLISPFTFISSCRLYGNVPILTKPVYSPVVLGLFKTLYLTFFFFF